MMNEILFRCVGILEKYLRKNSKMLLGSIDITS